MALCTIASIRQNFLLGRGRGGGGAVQKEDGNRVSRDRIFLNIVPQKM